MKNRGSKRADIVMSNLKREQWFKRYVERRKEKEEQRKREKKKERE